MPDNWRQRQCFGITMSNQFGIDKEKPDFFPILYGSVHKGRVFLFDIPDDLLILDKVGIGRA